MSVTVDPRAGIPKRLQLAAIIRERIRSGELPPGSTVPSGPALSDDYGVSRYTADRALDLLASEGLVQRISGVGTIVTDSGPGHTEITAPPGASITARMPAAAERQQLGMPPGVPVLVIEAPDGTGGIHAADRTVIRVPAPRLGR